MLPSPLPEELRRAVDRSAIELEAALVNREYAKAVDGYLAMYSMLLSSQPPERRYHKGYPLHNIGYGLLFQGDPVSAYLYFVIAYVEDLLSRPPIEGGPPRDTPAAKMLLLLYKIPEEALRAFDEKVLHAAIDLNLARDSIRLVNSTGIPQPQASPEAVLQAIGVSATPAPKLEPGQFPVPWEQRVFVGGSYNIVAVVREIARSVRAHGRFPVVVLDYRVVRDVHYTSLMLLHECRLAIFDISQEGGQLMEIERTRDFGVKTLVVRQSADPNEFRASGMVKALLQRENVEVRPYQTFAELDAIIADFLARNP